MKRFFCILLVNILLVTFSFAGDFEKGRVAYNKKDYKKAVYWFEKSAKQGYANAQQMSNRCYTSKYKDC